MPEQYGKTVSCPEKEYTPEIHDEMIDLLREQMLYVIKSIGKSPEKAEWEIIVTHESRRRLYGLYKWAQDEGTIPPDNSTIRDFRSMAFVSVRVTV